MNQLLALIWLKWTLFRNAMRSRKAIASSIAASLGTLAALMLALMVAVGLGFASYGISSMNVPDNPMQKIPGAMEAVSAAGFTQPLLFFFLIFAFLFLMWATVPLSFGGGNQFDPARLLLYPVSLKKLFLIDLLSELTSLTSIFALPALLGIAIGAGLRSGNISLMLLVAACAAVFGISLAKMLATAIGALMQRRRTRGETVVAVISVTVGLMGAFLGQFLRIFMLKLAPFVARHPDYFDALRWTPPGAAARAILSASRAGGTFDFALSLLTLLIYTVALVVLAYWFARRAALGVGGAKRSKAAAPAKEKGEQQYTGWQIPFFSPSLSALFEKEVRYVMRNAQLRMLILMPLILIGIRMVNTRESHGLQGAPQASAARQWFEVYGDGLMAGAGVLYVFLILSALACNSFAYEEGGMRALILAPVERCKILLAKNLTLALVAFIYAALLITVNELVFRDISAPALFFAFCCFLFYAASLSLIGNFFSLRFPKRMKYGKRMNSSGMAGFLLIPIILVLAVPPVLSTIMGWLAGSLLVKYATLLAFVLAALALYIVLIKRQARALAAREIEILEAVSGRTEN